MENGSKSTIIAESGDKTLKNILERLSSKSKINYKNYIILSNIMKKMMRILIMQLILKPS